MKRSTKMFFYPVVVSLTMAAGMAVAQSPAEVMEQTMTQTQERRTEGEQLKNLGEEDQLRQQLRVKENDPDQAKKVREMNEEQQGKQSKHQYRYEEKSPGQHMQQSGSRMGGGGGGGGRR